jgi:hypothetical protein
MNVPPGMRNISTPHGILTVFGGSAGLADWDTGPQAFAGAVPAGLPSSLPHDTHRRTPTHNTPTNGMSRKVLIVVVS